MESTKKKRKISMSVKMLIGMFLGIILGLVFGERVVAIKFVGDIFMNLLRMCIYPLIFISIVRAISNVADMKRLRKVGLLFLGYIVVGSTLSAAFGVISMHIFRPGADITLPAVETAELAAAAGSANIVDTMVSWIPTNPFASMANGDLIQIVFFAVISGIVLAAMCNSEAEKGTLLFKIVDALDVLMFKMINGVLSIAPFGVCGLMAVMVGTTGLDMVRGVATFLAGYWVAIIGVSIIVYPIITKFFIKESPLQFYKNIWPVIIVSMTTLSSAASIPVVMKTSKERCGIPADIVDLLTAPAATMNANGAACEFACYVIFASYLYNTPMSIFQVAFAIILSMMLSLGAAGIPGGGLVMATICLSVMGFPLDIVPVVAGVYTLLDLGATVMNVAGDICGMAYVASSIGELDRDVFRAKSKAIS